MKSLVWIIIIILLIVGIWYFAFYNDAYEDNLSEINGLNNNNPILVNQDFEIDDGDSGEAFYYTPGSRFNIFINNDFGRDEIFLTCNPNEGVIGAISSVPEAPEGYYAVTYEAISPGSCLFEADDFSVNLYVLNSESERNNINEINNI